MGFVGDIAGGLATGGIYPLVHHLGDLAPTNSFRAQAPVNTFQAQMPGMQNYGGAIQQGLAQSQQARGNQDQLIAALQQQAAGAGGPSPAQQMLSQALAQNQAQAAGTIGSQRGINPALAARMAVNQQANMGQQAAGQGALLRSQEQLGAQGMLGNVLAGQRQQDLGQFGQAGQFDLSQFLQGQGLNQQTAAQNAGLNLGAQQINAGTAAQNAQMQNQLIGGAISGLAGAAGMAATGKAHGGQIDSPRNDTVPAMLSPGEVVLPRSVALAEDAPERAAAFVRALHRSSGGPVPDQGYGRVLAKQRELEKRLKLVESGLMSKKESKKVGKAVEKAG